MCYSLFFFNDTAPTEIYTYLLSLSLHDALPIFARHCPAHAHCRASDEPSASPWPWPSARRKPPHSLAGEEAARRRWRECPDDARPARSEEHTSELQSLMCISYAVFCLKKKNKSKIQCKRKDDIQHVNAHS